MRVTLQPWTDADLAVLRRANSPELTRHLGGPETDAALVERHTEYLTGGEAVRMFRVEVDGVPAGYAGYWEQEHDNAPAYEVGCVIEPEWQGRGVATAALSEVVARAVEAGGGRAVVGYGAVGNEASHALCSKVGFTLEGTGTFPAGPDGGEPVDVCVWVIRP